MQGASGTNLFQIGFQLADAGFNAAAVGFQFGFTGTAGANAATEAGECCPLAVEAGQKIFQLRQLHLETTFGGTGAAGKNIEDKLGAVDDADAAGGFQIALLGGGELIIDDDDGGPGSRCGWLGSFTGVR